MDNLIRQRHEMGPSTAAFAASRRTQTPPTAADYVDDGDEAASADDAYSNPISNLGDDQYDSNDISSIASSSLLPPPPPPPPPSSRPSRLTEQMRPIAKSSGGGGGSSWQPVNAQRTILPISKQMPTPTVSAGRKAPTTTDRSINEINSIDANSNEDILDNNNISEESSPNLAKRLTMLDEPPLSMGEDFIRSGQRSSAFGSDHSMGDFSSSSSSSSNSRIRQTFLPKTTSGGRDVGGSHWPPTPTLLLQDQQQQSDYHLSPSLLLLSFVIIIFGACLRFKRRNTRCCWPQRWLGQKLSNLALKASGKSASTRRNNERDDSLEEDCCEAVVDEGGLTTTTPQKLLGCAATSGCSIKLVEQKPPPPELPTVGFSRSSSSTRSGANFSEDNEENPGRDDCDPIQSVAAADDDSDETNHRKGAANSKSLGRKIQRHRSSSEEGLSTMVILKRRFAKSPFLVAAVVARSTRPRVKLLTARVRKFIDDEAEELRAKTLINPTSEGSFGSRMFSFFLAPLASSQKSRPQDKDQEANDAQDEEKMLPSTKLLAEQEQQQEQEDGGNFNRRRHRLRCRGDDSSASIEAEIHRESNGQQSVVGGQQQQQQQAADKMVEMTLMGASLAVNEIGVQSGLLATEHRQPPEQQLRPPSASHPHHQSQLSPSPVIADGCSSLSGCTSLFSPSPIEHQPSCGCILSRERLASAAADLAAFGLLGRSKSQQGPAGSSACHLIEPNPATYRPCCSSVSPSALSHRNNQGSATHSSAIVAGESGGGSVLIETPRSPPADNSDGKYYPAQQAPLAGHYDFASSKIQHHNSLYGLPAGLISTGASNAGSIAGKCSNHIKRQYENYYDDERQDAYQRLTASIGIELGLNFDDNHHHHHEAAHTVGHAHTLSYAASNMADLLNFSRFDCHQSANVTSSATSCLPSADGGEFQQPLLPLELVKTAPVATSQQPQEILCPSPLCACQATASGAPISAPPMSILVQQPSMATPPPPPAQVSRSQQHPQVAVVPQSPPENNQQRHQNQHQQQQQYQLYQSCSANVSPTIKHSPSPANERRSAPESATTASNLSGAEIGNKNNAAGPSVANRGNVSPGTLSAAAGIRPKWRQRRHLSQMQQESADVAANGAPDCFPPPSAANTTAAWPASSALRQPRRTSIAGDQVSQVAANGAQDIQASSGQQHYHDHRHHYLHQSSHCGVAAHSAGVGGDGISPGGANRQLLQHRASIASDGTWNQANNFNQHRFGGGACLSQFEQQQAHHHHQLALQCSQRPSEASIYDPQYCSGALHGKSNYSSSGGSSSGIGISGSICTNASTGSVLQQYASFATTKTDGLLIGDYGYLQADQAATSALCGYPNYHQCNYYLHGAHPSPSDLLMAASGCQIPSCPSRKFSLPVQLELQTSSDPLSPTTSRAKLLFEKNLHRVDSSSLAAAANAQQQHRPRGLPGEAVAIRNNGNTCSGQLDRPSSRQESQQQQQQRFGSASSRPTFESRRSSQTITRQSSFWLEDNSVGSILSLTTSGAICMQSEDGSQLDVNQMPPDERTPFASQQQQRSHQQQQSGSQRPSISSSLVLSGDSIESVRQKPLVAQAPVEETPALCDNSLAYENDVFQVDTNINDADNCATDQQQHEAESTGSSSSNNNNNSSSSSNNSASQGKEARADDDVPLTSQPATSNVPKESTSSSASAMRDKRFNTFRTMAHMRNRLSSSSTTSSTTSSPSPDFGGRPSERIFGLASKSSTISKRRLFGKLRSRHYSGRLGASSSNAFEQPNNNNNSKIAGAAHRHSAPNSASSFRRRGKQPSEESAKSEGYTQYSTETDQYSAISLPPSKQSDPTVDGDCLSPPSERPISDLNSASLEHQCRELWKLRATLHDDTCVGDNWSNYHQRLNRRYDSGYKSIENQLSSSLEGNVLSANLAGVQAPPGRSPTPGGASAQQPQAIGGPHSTFDASLLVRPQSGCSGSICRQPQATAAAGATATFTGVSAGSNIDSANQQKTQQNITEMEAEYAKFTSTIVETDEEFSYQQEQEESIDDTIDGKLADLDLEDGALECLLGDAMDRECQSRSSKSSNEDDSRSKGLGGDTQNNSNIS